MPIFNGKSCRIEYDTDFVDLATITTRTIPPTQTRIASHDLFDFATALYSGRQDVWRTKPTGKRVELIPNRVRALRQALGLTQATLGKCTGISQVRICQYELGYINPTLSDCEKLAGVLGVGVRGFVTGESLAVAIRVTEEARVVQECRAEVEELGKDVYKGDDGMERFRRHLGKLIGDG